MSQVLVTYVCLVVFARKGVFYFEATRLAALDSATTVCENPMKSTKDEID